MGYTTQFENSFTFNKPLTKEQTTYLQKFAQTRRMKRDKNKIIQQNNSDRTAVGLPIGAEGSYYTGEESSILDHNTPPIGQPALWCQWIPNDEGTELAWDGIEKFYCYLEWLNYLIEHFFTPWNITLTGHVRHRHNYHKKQQNRNHTKRIEII